MRPANFCFPKRFEFDIVFLSHSGPSLGKRTEKTVKLTHAICLAALVCGPVAAQTCDLKDYKPLDGLTASMDGDLLTVSWQGAQDQQLRAEFTIREGQPVVHQLAARKGQGNWIVLGKDLSPEFQVTSGVRRLSEQQAGPLRALNIAITPEVIDREKWNAFWDAPLNVPGTGSIGLPRKPEEIRRVWATYHADACKVATNGARLEVTYPGLQLGIFAGDLRFTVYRGANLLRQEAIARTEEPSVAYKYVAGLNGFAIHDDTKIVWRDPARMWQQYDFGSDPNKDSVALKARNRVAILETGGGSLAFFPPSHKFFFAREIETNLGFVYYRKTNDASFALGVRQADREEPYKPYGVSDQEWDRRAHEARHDINNFALYNAPPGTSQHMPVYYYLSADDGKATDQAVLAFTHEDIYKAMPGFKVMVSHFHMHYNEMLTDAGTIDIHPNWVDVFRGLGVNIVNLADFHSDSHPKDPGPIRFAEQKVYFDGCRRFSDKDFLLIPGEEPDDTLGGHYITIMPRPVFWSQTRAPGHEFIENDPLYGNVYHVGSAADELEMLRREQGLMWQAHPRTKGSTGYPDAVREKEHFLSDRFLGASFQSLPVDQSEKRICEKRCLGLMDEMNNWAGPKYLIAEGDTYLKYPDDETYPQLYVNYVKLDRVPGFGEDWSPILKAMRAADFYVTSGEVLFRNWDIAGSGAHRTYNAEVEWTFPLEFAELVWGDGETTHTQMIPATDLPAFGSKKFSIPFDTTGKKWVRFAVWDSAGNGAFTQPVHFR
jgi:hypothetical protein